MFPVLLYGREAGKNRRDWDVLLEDYASDTLDNEEVLTQSGNTKEIKYIVKKRWIEAQGT